MDSLVITKEGRKLNQSIVPSFPMTLEKYLNRLKQREKVWPWIRANRVALWLEPILI